MCNNTGLKITTFDAIWVNIPAEAELSFENGSKRVSYLIKLTQS